MTKSKSNIMTSVGIVGVAGGLGYEGISRAEEMLDNTQIDTTAEHDGVETATVDNHDTTTENHESHEAMGHEHATYDYLEEAEDTSTTTGVEEAQDEHGYGNVMGEDLDGDGYVDVVAVDLDGDGYMETVGVDYDGDGVVDHVEMDLDGDGYADVVGEDLDGDGEIDITESVHGYDHDIDDDFAS